MNRITKSKEMPVYLFHQGTNAHAWELLGAHRQLNGKTNFCTWAPHAAAISVVGDFNGWDAAANPMTRLNEQGLWGATVELTHDYDCYKYQITTANGRTLYKADPFAFHTQTPPENASKIYRLAGYRWHDAEWMTERAAQDARSLPVNIYELHIGSWRRNADGNYYSYLQLAEELPTYLTEMGYTCKQFAFVDSNDMPAVAQEACDFCDVLYVPTDNMVASSTEVIDGIFSAAGKPIIAGEEGICKGCGVATLSISYYDLGYTTGEMAAKILTGEADVSTMPVEYAPATPKYNAEICAELGLTPPDGYEPIA